MHPGFKCRSRGVMGLHQKSRDLTMMGPDPFCTLTSDEREREGETLRVAI